MGLSDVWTGWTAAERAKKLRGDLDNFEMWFYHVGPAPDKPTFSLKLSTQPMKYSARSANWLDAVITKDEAAKVIDWMAKTGFLARAHEGKTRGPSYIVTVGGGGLSLAESMGWEQGVFERFDALKGLVNADAGKQIDKLAAAVKDLMPPATGKSHEPAK